MKTFWNSLRIFVIYSFWKSMLLTQQHTFWTYITPKQIPSMYTFFIFPRYGWNWSLIITLIIFDSRSNWEISKFVASFLHCNLKSLQYMKVFFIEGGKRSSYLMFFVTTLNKQGFKKWCDGYFFSQRIWNSLHHKGVKLILLKVYHLNKSADNYKSFHQSVPDHTFILMSHKTKWLLITLTNLKFVKRLDIW